MDFIERIFGISPDGGSGSFEMMLLFVPAAAVIGFLFTDENASGSETDMTAVPEMAGPAAVCILARKGERACRKSSSFSPLSCFTC